MCVKSYTLCVKLNIGFKITNYVENYTLHTVKAHTIYQATHVLQYESSFFFTSALEKFSLIFYNIADTDKYQIWVEIVVGVDKNVLKFTKRFGFNQFQVLFAV